MEKERMEEAIRLMAESVKSKNDEESRELLGDAIEAIQNDDYVKDPENFNLFIGYKMKNALETLVEAIREPALVQRTSRMATFVYTNYGFLKENIASLCTIKEGGACSVDKARFLINKYLKFTLTGEMPSFSPEKGKYWIPNFGNEKQWMDFCKSLHALYHGQPKEFFLAYSSLVSSEIKRFPYVLHTWYVEMKDGASIQIGHSWDEDVRIPMVEKEDFYLIHSHRIKDLKLEEYESTSEDPFPLTGWLKLPKSDIERIYNNSEEVER